MNVKVIITTHAQAGSGLILAFAMIAGNSSVFKTCLLNDSGIADFRTRLNALLASFQGEDILLLSDVKGGTPFNEAYKYGLEHPESTAVISGVNLPMLLELGTTPLSKQPLAAVAQLALNPGSDGIAQANLAATGDDDDLDF
ncbi:PTS sugar transporter subunit IIA [Pediococcus pentosaceus]|uniref:PTS sugar transporter subunit IIA n=1 Tax=Pediococcus pentosaceus TaxID=1255 RepID=UPI00200F2FCA|nr:PTS N'-diacetylchitobiose transporter subunit IIA [Pediococcus pentosaceus]UQB01629.1 PTS N'-diacetylchitobiose transporter subunit IIA [Pediococcus pentosaceus]